jgi:hypothetical protein
MGARDGTDELAAATCDLRRSASETTSTPASLRDAVSRRSSACAGLAGGLDWLRTGGNLAMTSAQ